MKVFVTVGTQLPFDRMIKTVSEVMFDRNIEDVVYQIGVGSFIPTKGVVLRDIAPSSFDNFFKESDIIISHAGIGSLLTASECRKPIIIMPRLSSFNEHRNDHQIATVKSFSSLDGVFSFYDNDDLHKCIDKALLCTKMLSVNACSKSLVEFINGVINE